MVRTALLLLFVTASAFAQKAELDAGLDAFQQGRYADAAQHFQRASQADPRSVTGRLYLGAAYGAQFIPGLDTPENQRFGAAAIEIFSRVVAMEPNNEQAIGSIASLYYNQKRWDDALEWNRKLLDIDPDTKTAWLSIGVISFTHFLPAQREARLQSKMRPDDPGPIRDVTVRQALKIKYMPMLDEGITALKRALEIDPEYDDAMSYMNLLLRYRADLLDTPAEYLTQTQLADEWVRKSLALKQKKSAPR